MGPRPAENAQALRKQRAAIEAIAADNMKLKEELMLANKFSVNPTSATAAALIANLQQQADVYAKKITEEQRLKAELEAQVEALSEKIAAQRVAMGGVNNSAEQSIKFQRKIVILEDRVQQASVRYNDALTRCRGLRDAVDSLRRERMLFEDLHKKMQRTLARRRQEMTEAITAISELHEAREKAIILQAQVKAQAEKDVANCEAEWRKLTEIIEADRRAREAQRQRKIQEREQQMSALFKQEFSLSQQKRRASTKAAGQCKGGDVPVSAAEKVKQYQEAFEKIKAATGTASIEELLEGLAAGEEANFRLFAYVNELNGEVEKLEEQIDGVRSELERHRTEAASKADDGAARALRDLEASLARTEAKAEAYEEKHSQAMRTANSLRAAVLDMFTRAGCATPAVMELLGEEGVTEANLMTYLGILEQRTNEVLNKYFALASDDSEAAAERAVAVLTAGNRLRTGGGPPPEFVIEPPSTSPGGGAGEDPRLGSSAPQGGRGAGGGKGGPGAGDEVGDDDMPLDLGALQARVLRTVASKAESAVKIKAVRPGGPGAGSVTPGAGGGGVGAQGATSSRK